MRVCMNQWMNDLQYLHRLFQLYVFSDENNKFISDLCFLGGLVKIAWIISLKKTVECTTEDKAIH